MATTSIVKQQLQPPTNACVKADIPNDSPENLPDGGADITKSVNELGNLAVAIQTFKSRYDELQKHLDFIEQAIDARSKELESSPSSASASVPNSQDGVVQPVAENGVVQLVTETEGKSSDSPNNLKSKAKAECEEGNENSNPNENEIVALCRTMNSRGLRKYIVSHLSDAATVLREQVPAALKSAPKPAKLVFECIGRFFLQGSKAYTKNSPMIPARQGSVLVLEYYLMSGCVESEIMEASLKNEASLAAVAWRKRLIVEGGVGKASEIDARGLVLFIAGFGIPGVFKNEDVLNLVRLSNPRQISHALRRSPTLIKRFSDIVDGMMKKGKVVEAVDLAYIFGFEEKLSPQTTLTSFLQKSEEAWKKTKQESHDHPNMLKEVSEKYLAALKSVVNCLEGQSIDFVKLLPGWQLKDKIINLEKEISDVNKKIEQNLVPKRKVDNKINSANKVKIPEAKRSRFNVKDPSVVSPSVTALQEKRIVTRMDGNSSYDSSVTAHFLDGRSYGYSNYYPSVSSVQIGSVSGTLAESYLGGTVAGASNMHGGAIAGSAMPAGIGAPSASYSGYQGDMMMDNIGTMHNSNGHPYRWHGIGKGALSDERSVGQSFVGQPASARVNSFYGRAATDGFTGLPDHTSVSVASRSRGSDLYSFADAVFDM